MQNHDLHDQAWSVSFSGHKKVKPASLSWKDGSVWLGKQNSTYKCH
jgi:hypothetical protein